MIVYHGTTTDSWRVRSINTNGLLKGTSVTTDPSIAKYYARLHSKLNNAEPIIFKIEVSLKVVRPTGTGKEYRLTETIKQFKSMVLPNHKRSEKCTQKKLGKA